MQQSSPVMRRQSAILGRLLSELGDDAQLTGCRAYADDRVSV
jgi:hypothetical protein